MNTINNKLIHYLHLLTHFAFLVYNYIFLSYTYIPSKRMRQLIYGNAGHYRALNKLQLQHLLAFKELNNISSPLSQFMIGL